MNKNTKKIFLSDFLANLTTSTISIYAYWYAYSTYQSQWIISILGFFELLSIFITTLGGGIADKYDKLYLMKFLNISRMVSLPLALLVENFGHKGVILLVILNTIIGGIYSPTLESLLPLLAKNKDNLYYLNSLNHIFSQLATITSALLSMIMINFFKFNTVIFLCIFLYLVAYLLLLFEKTKTDKKANPSIMKNIYDGLVYIKKSSYIKAMIPIAITINFFFWSISLMLPKISQDNYGKNTYSLLQLMSSFGGILGGIFFTKKLTSIKNKYKLFIHSLIFQSASLIGFGSSLYITNIDISLFLLFLSWSNYFFFNTIMTISYFSTIEKLADTKLLGAILGTIFTLFSFINPIAAISTHYILKYTSPRFYILISACIVLFISIISSKIKTIRLAFK